MKVIRTRRAGYLIALCGVAILGIPQAVEAIPAFARKYNTTCSRCHIGFPKLNTFGKNFKLSGYQQPGDAQLKKLSSDDDPNVSIIEDLPLAVLLKSRMDFPEWIGKEGRNSFGFFNEIELLYGDTVAPNIGFFGHMSFEGGESSIGKNSVIFSFLGDKNVFLQFGLLDLLENGVSPHYSLTSAPYGIFSANVGSFALGDLVRGVRLYGTVGSTITPELVRGDSESEGSSNYEALLAYRMEHGQDLTIEDEGSPYDTTRGLIWEFVISDGSAGGHGHGGEEAEHGEGAAGGTSPGVNDYWGRLGFSFNDNSQIGVFGYSGNTLLEHHPEGGGPMELVDNDFSFYGFDLNWEFGTPFDKAGVMQKPFVLQAAYLVGRADNPTAEEVPEPARLDGYFIELSYIMGQKSILTGRYDSVSSADFAFYNRESFTLNYAYYLKTNFAISGEYTRGISGEARDSLGLFIKFAF